MEENPLLLDMDILVNDMIFEEVMNGDSCDTDIDIYNRLVKYYEVVDLEHCVKIFRLIHMNMRLKQRLSNV